MSNQLTLTTEQLEAVKALVNAHRFAIQYVDAVERGIDSSETSREESKGHFHDAAWLYEAWRQRSRAAEQALSTLPEQILTRT